MHIQPLQLESCIGTTAVISSFLAWESVCLQVRLWRVRGAVSLSGMA